MKKVFLIGDSIRLGYQEYVKEQLDGIAEVYYPEDNCRFAQYTLRHLHEWAQDAVDGNSVDVVHWNNGLWDTLRIFKDEPLTPKDFYNDTLIRIHKRIKTVFPKAKIIFALSTPVIEERFEAPEKFVRYNKDTQEYNKIARKLMKELGVPVNDLYSQVSKLPEDAWSDCTHLYTDIGTRTLGDAVVKHIKNALGYRK
jgi:hypothetical protein